MNFGYSLLILQFGFRYLHSKCIKLNTYSKTQSNKMETNAVIQRMEGFHL